MWYIECTGFGKYPIEGWSKPHCSLFFKIIKLRFREVHLKSKCIIIDLTIK